MLVKPDLSEYHIIGKYTVNSRAAQIHAQNANFWRTVMAQKDSHEGYKYAYEMARHHYHGGGSSWESGAGAKAKSAYSEWQKADQARKEAERHAKAVGVAQEQAKIKQLGELEKLKLDEQKRVQQKKAQIELMKQAKEQAKRAKAQAQFSQVTRPRIKRQKRRSPAPKQTRPDFSFTMGKTRPRKTSLTDLW